MFLLTFFWQEKGLFSCSFAVISREGKMGRDVPIRTGTACHHTRTAEVDFSCPKDMLKTSINLPYTFQAMVSFWFFSVSERHHVVRLPT